MSIVVVKFNERADQFEFAADSQVTSYQTAQEDKDVKLFAVDGLVFGIVGRADVATLVRLYAQDHKPAKVSSESAIAHYLLELKKYVEDYDGELDECSFLIGWRGCVWYTNGFYIRPVLTYAAIGSGDEVALGALMMGASAYQAVEAATQINIYCQKPITTLDFSGGVAVDG